MNNLKIKKYFLEDFEDNDRRKVEDYSLNKIQQNKATKAKLSNIMINKLYFEETSNASFNLLAYYNMDNERREQNFFVRKENSKEINLKKNQFSSCNENSISDTISQDNKQKHLLSIFSTNKTTFFKVVKIQKS